MVRICRFPGTVITGSGVVSPLGVGPVDSIAEVEAGRTGVGPLEAFSLDGAAAGEAPPFDLRSRLKNPKSEKLMSRAARLAMFAASDAITGAQVDFESMDRERVGLQVASGNTGIDYDEFLPAFQLAWRGDPEADYGKLGGRASKLVDAYFSLRSLSNAGVGLLAAEHDLRGPSNNFVQEGGASAWALATAAFDLEEGRADAVLAGGYDSLIVKAAYLAFTEQGLLASDGVMAPFGAASSGVTLGEGAAFFLVEPLEQARSRGASPLGSIEAFVAGGQAPGDDWVTDGLPALEPDLQRAFESGLKPDYVIANGLSLRSRDSAEAAMLSRLGIAPETVSAWKGWTGYLGGSGLAVELALTLASVAQGFLPAPLAGAAPDDELPLRSLSAVPIRVSEPHPLILFLAGSLSGQACALWCRARCPGRGGA